MICCASAALLRCCLLVCFRESPLSMECDFFFFFLVKVTAAAELKCLAPLKHPKAHATAAAAAERFIWVETLSKGITCKKTRAVAFGQGLCLAGWPRSRFSFWIFLCDTNKHTHTEFSLTSSAPLFSAHSLCLWISACYFIALREREGLDPGRRRDCLDLGDTGSEKQGEEGCSRFISNVKPGYSLIHSVWR